MKQYVRKLSEAFRNKNNAHQDELDWSVDWNRQHPNPTREELVEFWRGDNLKNITPPSSAFPAGFDESAFLKRLWPLLASTSVVEIGCGFGRLASAFPPEIYLGLDINPEAIEKAKIHRPDYRFEVIDFGASYPKADLYLAYTVFLHIDDKNMAGLNRRLRDVCRQLLIVEIMDPAFRELPSAVPNFVRTRSDYQRFFEAFDLELEIRRPYQHYPGADISYLLFTNRMTKNRE